MWYFSWILGTGLALAFGVLNAMWYELAEDRPPPRDSDDRDAGSDGQPRDPRSAELKSV